MPSPETAPPQAINLARQLTASEAGAISHPALTEIQVRLLIGLIGWCKYAYPEDASERLILDDIHDRLTGARP